MENDEFISQLNAADHFCLHNHIRLLKAQNGSSEAILEVSPESLNAGGVVQGGAIFTLADFAFAGAANCNAAPGERMVMMSSNITVVRPGTGKFLTAHCHTLSRGRRTGLFETQVFDEANRLVAVITTHGFQTKQ